MPTVHMERALNSSRIIPTCGYVICMAAQSSLVILVVHTDVHFSLRKTPSRVVRLVAPCFQRYATQCWMATTKYSMGCIVVPWSIYMHLNPFLWSVKRIPTKVAETQVWDVEVISVFR